MNVRDEQSNDRTEELRLPWVQPKLHRLDAGNAEAGISHPHNDGVTNFS